MQMSWSRTVQISIMTLVLGLTRSSLILTPILLIPSSNTDGNTAAVDVEHDNLMYQRTAKLLQTWHRTLSDWQASDHAVIGLGKSLTLMAERYTTCACLDSLFTQNPIFFCSVCASFHAHQPSSAVYRPSWHHSIVTTWVVKFKATTVLHVRNAKQYTCGPE